MSNLLDNHGRLQKYRMENGAERNRPGSVQPYLLQRKLLRIIQQELSTFTRFEIIRSCNIELTAFERAVFTIPYDLEEADLRNALYVFENMGFDGMVRYLLTINKEEENE